MLLSTQMGVRLLPLLAKIELLWRIWKTMGPGTLGKRGKSINAKGVRMPQSLGKMKTLSRLVLENLLHLPCHVLKAMCIAVGKRPTQR
jgi:hypothetical protein